MTVVDELFSLHLCSVQKILIIQTAFIGDVVLATCLGEKLHQFFPNDQIDFLVRKGNESLLTNHPYLHEVLVWDKKKSKFGNLWKMLQLIRKNKYDRVINVQRFFATGFLTAFSGAKETIGFDKNPLSFLFTKKINHIIGDEQHPRHEIERNQDLIRDFTDKQIVKPKLYPSKEDFEKVVTFKNSRYITISPASVWFTKQFPEEKWIEFIRSLPSHFMVYLLGAASDTPLCERIAAGSGRTTIVLLCGKLSFLQSAALMKDAQMNYVNDSAPMHFASALNAPVTAVYCSTVPWFGFGPLSDRKFIVQVAKPLSCRPCGLHGYRACPLTHFHCARQIEISQLEASLG